MIDAKTLSVINMTLTQAKSIFTKKTIDYGTGSWRLLRVISVADQIFIKANRIKTILEKGEQKVNDKGDDLISEFMGIINYGIIGIIQNRLEDPKPGELPISNEEAINIYENVANIFNDYLKSQNPHYVEEIEKLNIKDISNIISIKVNRLKKITQKSKKIKPLIFGSFSEIIMWASIAQTTYKATQ